MLSSFRLLLAGFVALLLFAAPAMAAERAIIILDASGSMWAQINGEARISIARKTLDKVLAGVPEDLELGLMAYGHRELRGNHALGAGGGNEGHRHHGLGRRHRGSRSDGRRDRQPGHRRRGWGRRRQRLLRRGPQAYGPDAMFELPPGDYVLVSTVGGAKLETPFSIATGERTEVNAVLGAGVVAIAAPGFDKVEIFGAQKDIQGNRTSFTYGFGGELQTTLAAGDYLVVASPAEGASKEKAISVAAGERLEVTVE